MLGTCLSAGAAGNGDTSHGAMACILTRFLVMQVQAPGIVPATGVTWDSASPAAGSPTYTGKSFTSMVLMYYIAKQEIAWERRSDTRGEFYRPAPVARIRHCRGAAVARRGEPPHRRHASPDSCSVGAKPGWEIF
jgi:hypothetical protein